jgi:hypothetical protein
LQKGPPELDLLILYPLLFIFLFHFFLKTHQPPPLLSLFPNTGAAAISASVPERGRMVVVVRFPDPDDACRCSHDLATASEFSQKP